MGRGEVDGISDPEQRVNYIKYGQDRRETFKTFFHEWLHSVEFEYDIEIPHKLISALEDPFADLWEENGPELLELLLLCFGKR